MPFAIWVQKAAYDNQKHQWVLNGLGFDEYHGLSKDGASFYEGVLLILTPNNGVLTRGELVQPHLPYVVWFLSCSEFISAPVLITDQTELSCSFSGRARCRLSKECHQISLHRPITLEGKDWIGIATVHENNKELDITAYTIRGEKLQGTYSARLAQYGCDFGEIFFKDDFSKFEH